MKESEQLINARKDWQKFEEEQRTWLYERRKENAQWYAKIMAELEWKKEQRKIKNLFPFGWIFEMLDDLFK